MTRCGADAARGAAAVLMLLALTGAARADCFDWEDNQVTIRQGTLQGVPSGPLRWRIGSVAADHGRSMSTVELRWNAPAGRPQAQTLFQGIHDSQLQFSRSGNTLRLRANYCETGRDVCRTVTLPFAWDRASYRFTGATPAARQSLADVCEPEPLAPAPSAQTGVP
ncbi:hypothetical protein AAFN86_02205 [Roseomonas sp. CAU 1739]|uniref:hypothetical protein n=1 Tax=Roseomonas sp. CAU 1739 TaxID=3140364 RepID=UPI00325C1D33